MNWKSPLVLLSLLAFGCTNDGKDSDTGSADVDLDADGFSDAEDCDDNDSAVNPDATEVCDGIDNDCNGDIDDEDSGVDTSTASTFYADSDGDGYGDASTTIDSCAAPSGYTTDSTDCDDTDAVVYPTATELCDGQYNDCDDAGYSATAAPAAEVDGDTDGYVACDDWVGDSTVDGGGDCDDGNIAISPAATEVCDTIDNDCDSLVDDDDDSLDGSTGTTFYADTDKDGYGDVKGSIGACLQPAGYVLDSADCDDGDSAINPDAPEIPQNGDDENCDGYDGCTDLDCDDYTDIFVSSISSGAYDKTFLGDGTSLTEEDTLTGCGTYDSAYGDFNGDGYVDLVSATLSSCSDNNVFYGSSAGFSDKDGDLLAGSALEVAVEDLNSDGY
ncbi:MAG: hypothetical protein ACI8S6_001506, partial [Myxococcota bacterium]